MITGSLSKLSVLAAFGLGTVVGLGSAALEMNFTFFGLDGSSSRTSESSSSEYSRFGSIIGESLETVGFEEGSGRNSSELLTLSGECIWEELDLRMDFLPFTFLGSGVSSESSGLGASGIGFLVRGERISEDLDWIEADAGSGSEIDALLFRTLGWEVFLESLALALENSRMDFLDFKIFESGVSFELSKLIVSSEMDFLDLKALVSRVSLEEPFLGIGLEGTGLGIFLGESTSWISADCSKLIGFLGARLAGAALGIVLVVGLEVLAELCSLTLGSSEFVVFLEVCLGFSSTFFETLGAALGVLILLPFLKSIFFLNFTLIFYVQNVYEI